MDHLFYKKYFAAEPEVRHKLLMEQKERFYTKHKERLNEYQSNDNTKSHTMHQTDTHITNTETMLIPPLGSLTLSRLPKERRPQQTTTCQTCPAAVWHAMPQNVREYLGILKHGPLAPHEILIQLKEDISDRTLRRDLQALKEKGYVGIDGLGWKNKWFVKVKTSGSWPGHLAVIVLCCHLRKE